MNPGDTTKARRFLRALATTDVWRGSIALDAMSAIRFAEDMALNHRTDAARYEAQGRHELSSFLSDQANGYLHAAELTATSLGLAFPMWARPKPIVLQPGTQGAEAR